MVKEPGLSTTVTGLEADTDYSVQVAACNAVGMGAWSAAATVRTDLESQLSTEDPQPTQTSGDGNNGGGGGGSDENDTSSSSSVRAPPGSGLGLIIQTIPIIGPAPSTASRKVSLIL